MSKMIRIRPKQNKSNLKQLMSELSRYSVRSLSETKSSDRTRKFPITFCLGEKVSFYFTDQDFPLLLSFTLLVLHFIHNFSPL